MIFVIATIEIAEGRRDDFFVEFRQLVPLVREEEGCIEYGPTIDVETTIPAQGDVRGNVVTVVEKWASLVALENHLIAPHMLEYRKTVQDLVVQLTIDVLKPA